MAEGRKIGIALDFSKGSKAALKWAMEGILKKGDTLIVLHVKHPQGLESRNLLWFTTGSPLVPLNEFCDPEVLHSYGVEFESETFELLNLISRQLEVPFCIYAEKDVEKPRESQNGQHVSLCSNYGQQERFKLLGSENKIGGSLLEVGSAMAGSE